MSEELLQTIPQAVGKYTYYRLGNTTLNQLKSSGIIPRRDYGELEAKKPDGLVIYQDRVRAVVEYKQPQHLRTDREIANAVAQEIDVAKALCKILIVTDGTKSFWVNALNGDFIKDNTGEELRTLFHPFAVKDINNVEYLFDEIEGSISADNSTIQSDRLIDPTPIATRLWQTIWVATGKSTIKCLYNVVELFIFKFLSDLEVLPADLRFDYLYEKAKSDPAEALEFYASVSRRRIYRLFPPAADGTTIINGTIFVTESGQPNLSQSILFARCLEHLHKYGEEFGSLTKIDKQFKTKLYETFLNQEVESLGQYFTPRKVVQAIIRMAGINQPDFQFGGQRFCDPFCGVGGFPLEMLNMNEGMMKHYTPNSAGKITLPFVIHGFDKGFERDDERTIILAKANMLIYLAELLATNPSCTTEFARVFNETFRLFKDNLGTYGYIIKDDAEKYDFILSNPPYVTRGSSIIKAEIQSNPNTIGEYPIGGLGLESLAIEWVVKSLKPGGRAFLIIPDGILARTNGRHLRDYLLQECFLNAIVSLPRKTFFANEKDTYVLVITKKNNRDNVQTAPVFAYLVSNIGERLTSVKRDEIDLDDLPEMVTLFRQFVGAPTAAADVVASQSLRCKVFPIVEFRESRHWIVNKWWTAEELALLESDNRRVATKQEFEDVLMRLQFASDEYQNTLMQASIGSMEARDVCLGDKTLFRMFIGNRLIKGHIQDPTLPVPVYSANVFEIFGWVQSSNVGDFTCPSLIWGIDGEFDVQYIPPGQSFATTDHCGTVQVLENSIVPEYLLYAVSVVGGEARFTRSYRPSLTTMRDLKVKIPVLPDGTFDVDAQQQIAAAYIAARSNEKALKAVKQEFDEVFARYAALG